MGRVCPSQQQWRRSDRQQRRDVNGCVDGYFLLRHDAERISLCSNTTNNTTIGCISIRTCGRKRAARCSSGDADPPTSERGDSAGVKLITHSDSHREPIEEPARYGAQVKLSVFAPLSLACAISVFTPVVAYGQPKPPPPPPPPAPAAAPAPPSRPLAEVLKGEAKAEYDSAKVLYNDGDYTNAVLKFSTAYDKSHDPRLLWNMAACEKNLRHYARALRHVRKYAADTSGLVTDQERTEATELIKVMEPLTAKLRVNVAEPGVEILIDDEVVGTTPIDAVVVDIGLRKVRGRKAGFTDGTREVPVGGAPEVSVDLVITKIEHVGRVVVKAGTNDTIAIDGTVLGTGSWSGPISSGGHTLRITAPSMRPYQAEILVNDEQTREIAVTLEPEQTRLPLWVWIAGGAVVTTGLAVGAYFLFRSDDYDGPTGNLAPGLVYASRPFRW
jgi:hypothetical protein